MTENTVLMACAVLKIGPVDVASGKVLQVASESASMLVIADACFKCPQAPKPCHAKLDSADAFSAETAEARASAVLRLHAGLNVSRSQQLKALLVANAARGLSLHEIRIEGSSKQSFALEGKQSSCCTCGMGFHQLDSSKIDNKSLQCSRSRTADR